MDISDERWAEAVRRKPAIRPLAACSRKDPAAVTAAARDLGLSRSQVYRLIKAFREKPVTQSLVVGKPGSRKGARRLRPEVEVVIEEVIGAVYKRRERPTKQYLLREIRAACRAAGFTPPSRKAVSSRLAAHPPREMAKAREGAKAARNRYDPVRPGLRPSTPLAIVQIDHTKVDVQLVDDLSRALLGRPWLTLLLDVFSRCVLGFTLSFDPPSAAGVAQTLTQGVLPKQKWLGEHGLEVDWPMHGIPERLHLDNASEFHSRALERGCEQHGIFIDYRPPGRPHFGGHIERLMGTLMKRVQALPGTTSSNVVERGDYPSEEKAVLTLREFERIFAMEVLAIYHNEKHSGLGKAPLMAWAEGIAKAGNPRLPPDPEAFVLDFLPFEERIVGREGVRLFNVAYFDGTLAALVGSSDRRRRVKYDPRDISAVFVEMPDGSHCPTSELLRRPGRLEERRVSGSS
jgi:putative transposase